MIYESEIFLNEDRQEYWKNDAGEWHREDGPAFIGYYKNGNIKEEYWLINGERHRTDGPAFIEYHSNGNIKEELYLINGKRSRVDGPADIEYDTNGNIIYKKYWCNDHHITDIVKKIFGCIPDELTKEEQVLLKLSLPEECFT